MWMTPEQYKKCLAGYRITGCAIRARDVFYFVAERYQEHDADSAHDADDARGALTKMVVCFAQDAPNPQWSSITFSGFDALMAGAVAQPLAQFVGVDSGGQVVAVGSGAKTHEARMPRGPHGPQRGALRRLKTLDGRLYCCSGYRGLGYRQGPQAWVSLCTDLPPIDAAELSDEALRAARVGFADVARSANADLYAGGDNSDLWRLRDGQWTRLPFPPGQPISAIGCDDAGTVYVGTEQQAIWRGHDETWTLLRPANAWASAPCRDIVCYQGRVLTTLNGRLFEVIGDRVEEAAVGEAVQACCDHLQVGDGVLLAASEMGAAYHDGQRWHVLFRRDPWEERLLAEPT